MLNTIASMLVAGVLTASGAHYLQNVEMHSTHAADAYMAGANKRFQEYEKILPGSVEYPIASKPRSLALDLQPVNQPASKIILRAKTSP